MVQNEGSFSDHIVRERSEARLSLICVRPPGWIWGVVWWCKDGVSVCSESAPCLLCVHRSARPPLIAVSSVWCYGRLGLYKPHPRSRSYIDARFCVVSSLYLVVMRRDAILLNCALYVRYACYVLSLLNLSHVVFVRWCGVVCCSDILEWVAIGSENGVHLFGGLVTLVTLTCRNGYQLLQIVQACRWHQFRLFVVLSYLLLYGFLYFALTRIIYARSLWNKHHYNYLIWKNTLISVNCFSETFC